LKTRNSCVSSEPLLVTLNVISPAGAEFGFASTANSCRVTSIPPPVPPVAFPPSFESHPATIRSNTARMRISRRA
jgi:hypothetical protein